MAAPSDSPTRFRGQPWSNWTDFLGRESPISDEDDPDRPEPDAMRLPKEDMGLFGLCPETDNFYVVICELCEACVKPQGLVNHMELWHKAETTDALPPPEPPEKISNSKGGTSKGSATNKLNVGNKVKVKRPVTAACSKLERATSNVEEQTSTETEKMTLPHTDLQQSSNSVVNAASSRPANQTATPAALLQPVVALTPLGSPTHLSSATATSAKSSVMATSPALISATSTLPNMAIDTSSSSFSSPSPCKKRPKVERKLPVKEREYDPDKHCGVWNGENSKPCTRSLTCKSHSLSMRRAVSGRSKHFDKLLADHRAAKDAAAKMKPVPSVPAVLGQLQQNIENSGNFMNKPLTNFSPFVVLKRLPKEFLFDKTSVPLSGRLCKSVNKRNLSETTTSEIEEISLSDDMEVSTQQSNKVWSEMPRVSATPEWLDMESDHTTNPVLVDLTEEDSLDAASNFLIDLTEEDNLDAASNLLIDLTEEDNLDAASNFLIDLTEEDSLGAAAN